MTLLIPALAPGGADVASLLRWLALATLMLVPVKGLGRPLGGAGTGCFDAVGRTENPELMLLSTVTIGDGDRRAHRASSGCRTRSARSWAASSSASRRPHTARSIGYCPSATSSSRCSSCRWGC